MESSRLSQLFEFLKEDPADPFTIYAIATEYVKTDEKKALEYFNKLMSEHQDYIGTYYQAGKLSEQMGRKEEAEKIYKKGMEVAQKIGKMHALSELRSAYNALLDLDYE